MLSSSVSVGGYVGMILVCAKTGDLSPLSPVSVKDAIWLSSAVSILEKRKDEERTEIFRQAGEIAKRVILSLADVVHVQTDIDSFVRAIAQKGSRRLELIKTEDYPSMMEDKLRRQHEYDERRKNMTQEERDAEDLKAFNSGMKYTP